jgi:hypothetical protein
MSPIDLSASAIATAAAFADTPCGGSWRAISKARSRACGSARSCIRRCDGPCYLIGSHKLVEQRNENAKHHPKYDRTRRQLGRVD